MQIMINISPQPGIVHMLLCCINLLTCIPLCIISCTITDDESIITLNNESLCIYFLIREYVMCVGTTDNYVYTINISISLKHYTKVCMQVYMDHNISSFQITHCL